jgi:hypothetical protein
VEVVRPEEEEAVLTTDYLILVALAVITMTFAFTFFSLLRAREEVVHLTEKMSLVHERAFEQGWQEGRRFAETEAHTPQSADPAPVADEAMHPDEPSGH